MIEESQNIEHKESWRDEYLKLICGFANAQGGRVYIGVDDDRQVTGVEDSKRLMEDIPNKIRDVLGIIVDVAAQVNAMGAEERAIPILEHVLKNHRVTNGDVQKMLGVSKPTATRLLQKLDAVLELVGHGVGSYYRIRNY